MAEWSRALDIKLSDWYINGVSSNPVEERIKICQLKDLILTVWFNFQVYIYIYVYQRMLLNFAKIRTQKVEDPVANPFYQKNHCVKNFKVIGIEKTGNGDKIYRETKESL